MGANLLMQSVVVAAKDQVSCNLEGEAAILSLAKGTYYGLDSSDRNVATKTCWLCSSDCRVKG